jgi:hypothetical protein
VAAIGYVVIARVTSTSATTLVLENDREREKTVKVKEEGL